MGWGGGGGSSSGSSSWGSGSSSSWSSSGGGWDGTDNNACGAVSPDGLSSVGNQAMVTATLNMVANGNMANVKLVYNSSTGELHAVNTATGTDVKIGSGYSGYGFSANDPSQESIANTGPIPAGTYSIGTAFNSGHSGPETMTLTPNSGTDVYGRTGFEMHGDTATSNQFGLHDASDGCIIMDPNIRYAVGASGISTLEVVH